LAFYDCSFSIDSHFGTQFFTYDFGTNRSKAARTFPDPDVLVLEIAEELEAALEQFCGDRGGFEALML
jgi:hypothetical protein